MAPSIPSTTIGLEHFLVDLRQSVRRKDDPDCIGAVLSDSGEGYMELAMLFFGLLIIAACFLIIRWFIQMLAPMLCYSAMARMMESPYIHN